MRGIKEEILDELILTKLKSTITAGIADAEIKLFGNRAIGFAKPQSEKERI